MMHDVCTCDCLVCTCNVQTRPKWLYRHETVFNSTNEAPICIFLHAGKVFVRLACTPRHDSVVKHASRIRQRVCAQRPASLHLPSKFQLNQALSLNTSSSQLVSEILCAHYAI